jgi:hypothetical protein
MDQVIERYSYYLGGKRDFVVFQHGTCVVLPNGQSDQAAAAAGQAVLAQIFGFHPDMNPTLMDDGNLLVRYNHPAFNVVLKDFAQSRWTDIEANTDDALTPDEVLMTPLGPNKFDAFGKMALLGRCYFFMDAQDPQISALVRRTP